MEFKHIYDGYAIKIGNIWYTLCACANCKKVHAFHKQSDMSMVDEKIKCCKNPTNWAWQDDVNDEGIIKSTKIINLFMEKYQ